jgi:hypothetical protein
MEKWEKQRDQALDACQKYGLHRHGRVIDPLGGHDNGESLAHGGCFLLSVLSVLLIILIPIAIIACGIWAGVYIYSQHVAS